MNVTLVDGDMPTWAPDTRHYVTASGDHIAVHVDAGVNDETAGMINETLEAMGIPTLKDGIHQIVVSDTTILACNKDGTTDDLTPLNRFPPGTSHQDALTQAGYTLTE